MLVTTLLHFTKGLTHSLRQTAGENCRPPLPNDGCGDLIQRHLAQMRYDIVLQQSAVELCGVWSETRSLRNLQQPARAAGRAIVREQAWVLLGVVVAVSLRAEQLWLVM